MTEKRFTETISTMTVTDNQTGREYKCEMGIDTDLLGVLNMLHEENQSLKEINKRCSDSHLRMRNRLERLHKDWDKLWEICKDKGMTEEEIIAEMER